MHQVAIFVIIASHPIGAGAASDPSGAAGPSIVSFLSLEQATAAAEAKAQKKAKKEKKKSDAVAPDEEVDADQTVDQNDGPSHFVWKQHPSIRYGKVFRLDFQAKLQEDAHGSYAGAHGVECPNTALPS